MGVGETGMGVGVGEMGEGNVGMGVGVGEMGKGNVGVGVGMGEMGRGMWAWVWEMGKGNVGVDVAGIPMTHLDSDTVTHYLQIVPYNIITDVTMTHADSCLLIHLHHHDSY